MESVKNRVDLLRNWPAQVGFLFIILGTESLLSYAFQYNWLNLMFYFLLTLLLGISTAVLGLFSMAREKIQGSLLVALSSFTFVLSCWMGNTHFHLFSSTLSFTGMLIALFFSSLVALRFKNKKLMLMTSLIAMTIPFFSNSPSNQLLSYLFLVDCVAIFLCFLYWAWPAMITCISSCAYFFQIAPSLSEDATFELFMRFFFLLFYLPSLFLIRKHKMQPFSIVLLSLSLIPFWEVLCNFSVNGFFLIGTVLLLPAYLLSRLSLTESLNRALSTILGIEIFSCVTLGIYQSFEDGLIQNSALFIEVLTVLFYTGGLFKSRKGVEWASLAFLIPIFQSALHLEDSLFLVAMSTLAIAGILLNLWKEPLFSRGLFSLSGLYGLALIWTSSHQLFASIEIARGVALVIYTAIGVAAIMRNNPWLYTTGLFLLLGVVGRLLIFEIWHMSTLNKIFTFLSIGALLLLTALSRKIGLREMQLQELQNQKV